MQWGGEVWSLDRGGSQICLQCFPSVQKARWKRQLAVLWCTVSSLIHTDHKEQAFSAEEWLLPAFKTANTFPNGPSKVNTSYVTVIHIRRKYKVKLYQVIGWLCNFPWHQNFIAEWSSGKESIQTCTYLLMNTWWYSWFHVEFLISTLFCGVWALLFSTKKAS